MNWLLIGMIAMIVVLTVISYLIGRDNGETAKFLQLTRTNERLMARVQELSMENNRLKRAMDYYDTQRLQGILEAMDDGTYSGYQSDDWE